ncbi:Interstitial collagenase [Varanus komodoensis]|uniref:stromelysin-1-like n=1 Tax=Varanus komodoensis TaxID=61221 RepID=UPI001CF77E58|nr:stromelysin-1-like [Varanus komodoensis]KAF7250817.1 Interstitial collagenase [Varanus komodoensis]
MKSFLMMNVLFGALPCVLLNLLQDMNSGNDYDDDDETSVPPSPPNIPPENPSRDLCKDPLTFDAVTSLRGEKFFFKHSLYLRKSPFRKEIKNVPISTFWPTLESGMDAAYEVENLVYFIKGENYWAFYANIEEPGYPKSIHSLGFPEYVKKIDAAVYEENSRKIYFFSGNKYWTYDEAANVMEQGPKLIETDFPGIGTQLDAAFEHAGKLYFFSGPENVEFDIKHKRVTKKMKNNVWFGCV